jgi:hypothetical protein
MFEAGFHVDHRYRTAKLTIEVFEEVTDRDVGRSRSA